jgi:hypothetical protein
MKNVIIAFDKYLKEKSLKFDAVIIGGGALIIMSVIDRKTKDIDCLDPEIPTAIKKASQDFSRLRREFLLDENWLNNGPVTLKRELPSEWQMRLQELYVGEALKLKGLGRNDLIKSKLFAYCDRTNPDYDDLIKLCPTLQELNNSIEWVKYRDGNPGWPAHVEIAFTVLKKALKYE